MTWMKWQLFIVATLQLLNITVDMYFFLIGFYQCEASTIWKAKCLELQFWGMKPNRNTKMMGGCGELWGAATGTAVGST